MKFGDIYRVDLGAFIGTDRRRIGNVIVLQNTICAQPETVWCAKISTKLTKLNENFINLSNCGIEVFLDSCILLDQSSDIEVERLKEKVGSVSEEFSNIIKEKIIRHHYIIGFHDGVTVLELCESSNVAHQNARNFIKRIADEHKVNYSTHIITIKMSDDEKEWNDTDRRCIF